MRKFYALALTSLLLLTSAIFGNAQTVSNYGFTPSSGTFTPLAGGTPSTATGDDATQNLAIGFPFTFGGVSYPNVIISSNGSLKLAPNGSTTFATHWTNNLSNLYNNPIIAAIWDDNNTTGGSVTYLLQGSAPNRTFTVQWENIHIGGTGSSSTPTATFKATLFEGSNNIEIQYGTVNAFASTSASIGLNDLSSFLSVTPGSPATASSVTANNSISTNTGLTSGTTYTFAPPPMCTGTPTPGTIPSSVSACINSPVVIAATGFTSGVAGLSFQWEESPDGSTGWANVTDGSGGTTTTYTTGAVTVTRYYRMRVTCSNGGGTDVTNTATVSTINCSYDVTKTSTSYTSISGSGTSMSGWRNGNNTDDNMSTAQPIGFAFNYKGSNYTQFSISTNGFLTFNVGTSAVGGTTAPYNYVNTTFTTVGTGGTILTLAPFYDDLVVQGNPTTALALANSFKYQLDGVAPNRVLTVEWISMETFNNTGPNLNFQVKLHETTNVVEFVYGTMELFNGTSNFGFSYTMGINGGSISASPTVQELQTQQIDNLQNFSSTPKNDLARFMDCNTVYTFTPGNYAGGATEPPLVNDDQGGAIILPVNPSACTNYCGTYYTTRNATATASIPVCTAGSPGTPDDDVWFRFTATSAQQVITVRSGSGFDAVVQLLDNSFAALNCVNATGAGLTETINATVTAGNVYYIRIYHAGAGSSQAPGSGATTAAAGMPDFSICINEIVPPPANDDPCGAVVLTVSSTCTPYSDNSLPSRTSFLTATTTSTNGVVTPSCTSAGANVQDVWFSFVATSSEQFLTVTPVAGVNPAVEVYTATGSCAGTDLVLSSIGCVNSTSTGSAEQIEITGLTGGATYYIRVYQHPSGQGGAPVSNSQFSICVFAPVPACVTNVSPANAATGVSTTPTLSWNSDIYASSYDVYIGTANPPTSATPVNVATTSYTVPGGTPLSPATVYYWFVVPRNANGTPTGCESNTTSFTTVSCPVPTSVSVTNVTGTTADVNFTSAGTSFIVEYGAPGFTPGTGATAGGGTVVTGASSTIQITGLTAGTSYSVYVRQDCGGGFFSTNSTVVNFGTSLDCGAATVIAACATPQVANIAAGTGSYDNDGCGFSTPGREALYSFTPSITGVYRLNVTATSNSEYVDYMFKNASGGCGPDGWTCIDDINDVANVAIGTLTAGQTYFILLDVESTDGTSHTFELVCPSAPPANDECAGAITLTVNPDYSCGTVTAGTTFGATESMPGCGGDADDDVWFSFVATSTSHRVTIQNVSGFEDMEHEVFSGTCAGLVSIECSDPNTSDLTGLTIGNTYYVRVYSYFDELATFDICVGTAPSAPANDEAPGAILLTVNATCTGAPFTNAGATQGANEPSGTCSSNEGFATVWYRFVAPASGAVRISTDVGSGNTLTDSRIALFSTTNVNDYSTFNIISCDEDGGTVLGSGWMSVLYATGLLEGTTYYIQVDRFSDSDDDGSFCITVDELNTTMLSTTNTCASTYQTPISGDASITYTGWVPLLDGSGRLVALVRNAAGGDPDDYTVGQNVNVGPVRQSGTGNFYLDRNFRIANSTATNVDVQFFFLQSEMTALNAANGTTLATLVATRQTETVAGCHNNFSGANGEESTLPQTGNGISNGVNWIQVTTPAFSNFYLNSNLSVLPVNLLTFSGQRVGNSNQLKWKTATEQQSKGFQVERSTDGINFTSIAFVNSLAPNGNSSSQLSYSFNDNNLVGSKQFYRLRQVDLTGTNKLSNVIMLKGDKPTVLALGSIFPNPVKSKLNLVIETPSADQITLLVTDVSGKLIKQQKAYVETGTNTLDMDVNSLSSGTYIIKVICSSGCESVVGRFVKY